MKVDYVICLFLKKLNHPILTERWPDFLVTGDFFIAIANSFDKDCFIKTMT